MSSNETPTVELGDLLDALQGYPRTTRVSFSGLTFYRVKQRGDDLVQIEFNQQVFLDGRGNVVVQNLE